MTLGIGEQIRSISDCKSVYERELMAIVFAIKKMALLFGGVAIPCSNGLAKS